MANSKKPPFVAPAKPASPAPVIAKPAIASAKPALVAPVAPSIAKPAAPAPAPVTAKVESPKVESPKVASVKVEPVKVAPVRVEAPKPAAPVVAKVETPVAPKPVAPVQKPVEAVKVPVAPKAVETVQTPVSKPVAKATAKATLAFPIADVMKPVAALQENVRANTEKALSEFRGRYAEVKGFAETATTRLEDSMKAAQSGSREFGFALFEIAKAQTQANLDHAKTLAGAKSFVLSQFQSAQASSKDVATLAGKIANDVASPLRASFELMLRR
jgi:hypothetical protein